MRNLLIIFRDDSNLTQKHLFETLGAPLNNYRWSWGSVRPQDGAVFLRVWEDRTRLLKGSTFVQATHRSAYKTNLSNAGYRERERHVDLIKAGATFYLVMCEAVDTKARPRAILRFNESEVFRGGRAVELEGETWVEMLSPIPIRKVALG